MALAGCWCSGMAPMRGAEGVGRGAEVVLLYVRDSAESKAVAEYYAARRGVPDNQLIALNVPAGDNLSRADFTRLVEMPLIEELQKRKLCRYELVPVPATPDALARIAYKCVESQVRYLVPTFGFPYRIPEDPTLKEAVADKLPEQMRRNEAALDSDLAILGAKGFVPYVGCVPNFALDITNAALLHPTNGIFLVTRLDGPTAYIAKGLVDKAMSAETNGLFGHAYLDERGIREGPYALGDQWITNTAWVTRLMGYTTYVDHKPETLPASFPLSEVAVYAGWYDLNASGPFLAGTAEFMPGAIAYHIHSFSAFNLRSLHHNWVGPLLNAGATVTMGCVAEPYLGFTPQPHRLVERMLVRGFTFGEASLGCQSHLSWQNVFVGDPLYRPLGGGTNQMDSLQQLEATFKVRDQDRMDWLILRKVNLYLQAGKSRGLLLRDLQEIPQSTNSPVIAEKIAQLQADSIDFREAIRSGRRAVKLSSSPGQKLRLLQNMADWQEFLGRHGEALTTLGEIETLRPDFREMVSFRQRQLALAREASLPSEVERLMSELERLNHKP